MSLGVQLLLIGIALAVVCIFLWRFATASGFVLPPASRFFFILALAIAALSLVSGVLYLVSH